MTSRIDLDGSAVTALLECAAREELLPRFRTLAAHQVFSKATADDPTDVVTEADLAMEARLGPELEALLPGSVILGEEAVAKDPSLLALLSGDRPVWVLDPLDGTRNFAAGRDDFGVLLALCDRGSVRWGFLHEPIQGRTFVAEAGSGAFLGGMRLRAPATDRREPPSGMVATRFMTAELRESVEARAATLTRRIPQRLCAASEYSRVLRREMDFVLYWRLLPWDHLGCGLIVTEADGAARHPDGNPCGVADGVPGSLVTHDSERWDEVRGLLFG